jgi:hypothetical protein
VVAWLYRDRGIRRARHIRAMAQEAEGDAGRASVDTASRANRKCQPDHRGRVHAITKLIEKGSGANKARLPWWGAWLQRTNLWRERTNLRTGSQRLRGVISRLDPRALAFFGPGIWSSQIVDKQLAVHDEEAATRHGACDCKLSWLCPRC